MIIENKIIDIIGKNFNRLKLKSNYMNNHIL